MMTFIIALVLFVVTFVTTFVVTSVMTIKRFGSLVGEYRTVAETSLGMACLVICGYLLFESVGPLMAAGVFFIDSTKRVTRLIHEVDDRTSKLSPKRTEEFRREFRKRAMKRVIDGAINVAISAKPGTVICSELLTRTNQSQLRHEGIYHVTDNTYVVKPHRFQIVSEFVCIDGHVIPLSHCGIINAQGEYRDGIPAGEKLDTTEYQIKEGCLTFKESSR